MIRLNPDESIDIETWIHPRSLKLHIRQDCRAMRPLIFEHPTIKHFDSHERAEEWFRYHCTDDNTCRWCFPRLSDASDPE